MDRPSNNFIATSALNISPAPTGLMISLSFSGCPVGILIVFPFFSSVAPFLALVTMIAVFVYFSLHSFAVSTALSISSSDIIVTSNGLTISGFFNTPLDTRVPSISLSKP